MLFVLPFLAGCNRGLQIPRPRAGVAEVFKGLMVNVPGGRVNASGGNLLISREDMTVDSQVGTWAVGAVWNSASGAWHWNFDSSLKLPGPGAKPMLTDDTGCRFYLKAAQIGEPIAGSYWVWHDEDAVRTAGGLVHEFDAAGELAFVNWTSAQYPALRFVRSEIGSSSKVMRIEQCKSPADCSTLYTMTYDETGRLLSIVDLAGRAALYTYDGDSMRIAIARDSLDVANSWPGTRYEYDEVGRLSAITNSHDERVEYQYYGPTSAIRKAIEIGEGDPLWEFVYEGLNGHRIARTTVVDPLGGNSEYRFDISLRLWRLINPGGESWSWQWRGDTYERALEVSPAGVERYFEVVSDDVITETQSNGNVITRTFAASPAENREDPYRRPTLQIEDELGLIEARTYSSQGLLESVSTGAGDLTTFVTEATGDLTVTDPAGVMTLYANLGDHGHHLSSTRGAKTVNYTYDLVGNLLSADGLLDEASNVGVLSPAQGGVVQRSYDADRNIAVVTLEDGGIGAQGVVTDLRIEWRADHQRARIERPYQGDTEFYYNALGRMTEERTRVDGTWVSTFVESDLMGRTTAILKPNGMASRFAYNSAGKIKSVAHERDWTDTGEIDAIAEFDYANGRLVAIRDSTHARVAEERFYDAQGFTDVVRFPGGESLTIGRDLRGRIDTKQYWRPDASLLRTFEYDYDLADRHTAVREDGNAIANLTYGGGRVEEVLYANGVTVVYDYDPATGALAGFTAANHLQQLVASMSVAPEICEMPLPGIRCVAEQTDSLIGVVSTSLTDYYLEDQGSERLIIDAWTVPFPTHDYNGYDELSNVQRSRLGTFIYNPEHNRLLSIEGSGETIIDYEYDEAGFVIERSGVPVAWSGSGRVESVGADLSMQWDALGRKVSATTSGQETHWKYGGEITEDELGANQKLDLGWVVCRLDDFSHEYRLSDFRGNSKLLISDAAEVIVHRHYAGYGQVAVDGNDESSIGFANGAHVGELVVIGKRVYDPAARRFLSRDPIFQVINQYSYTFGNPVRFWDPGGDQSFTVKGVSVTGGFLGPVPYAEVSIEWGADGSACESGSSGEQGASSPGNTGSGAGETSSSTAVPEGGGGAEGGGGSMPASPGVIGGGAPSAGLSCGLGFEIAPLLMACFLARRRYACRAVGSHRSACSVVVS